MLLPVNDKNGKQLSLNAFMIKVANRIYNIFLEFQVFFLHIVGYTPSHVIRNFWYGLNGVTIGYGSTIHMGARFYDPSNIFIGEDTIIGEGVVLDGRAKLQIGNHVDIASEVMIYNAQHDTADEDFKSVKKPVIIEDYVFIGPRVIILPGVTIGKGAVVGAGAVVTKDIPSMIISAGVPAKAIGERKNKNLAYKLGRSRLFR